MLKIWLESLKYCCWFKAYGSSKMLFLVWMLKVTSPWSTRSFFFSCVTQYSHHILTCWILLDPPFENAKKSDFWCKIKFFVVLCVRSSAAWDDDKTEDKKLSINSENILRKLKSSEKQVHFADFDFPWKSRNFDDGFFSVWWNIQDIALMGKIKNLRHYLSEKSLSF